jgi:hypothetical protein
MRIIISPFLGFYDDVSESSPEERSEMSKAPYNENEYRN